MMKKAFTCSHRHFLKSLSNQRLDECTDLDDLTAQLCEVWSQGGFGLHFSSDKNDVEDGNAKSPLMTFKNAIQCYQL